ncbi:MAG: type II CAAX endopeptidase family protein [Gemmatimonadota bacterium]
MLRDPEGRLRLGWRVLLFLALFLGVAAFGLLVPLPGIPGATLPVLVAALVAGWVLLAVEGRPPGALGFHLSRAAGRETVAGLALGIGVALLAVAAIALAGGLGWSLTSWEGVTAGSVLLPALGALWLFTIPAFAEEALFRGYPFQALAESWGTGAAVLVTSALFATLHLWNPHLTVLGLLNIFAAGVFLGAIYVRTASLWWVCGVHLGWNWGHGFLTGLPVSGLDLAENPLIEASQRGPDWLSGGGFGPEGSALSVLVLLGVSAAFWRTERIRPEQFGPGALRDAPLWIGRMRPRDRSIEKGRDAATFEA